MAGGASSFTAVKMEVKTECHESGPDPEAADAADMDSADDMSDSQLRRALRQQQGPELGETAEGASRILERLHKKRLPSAMEDDEEGEYSDYDNPHAGALRNTDDRAKTEDYSMEDNPWAGLA